jgi:hypothetical protein
LPKRLLLPSSITKSHDEESISVKLRHLRNKESYCNSTIIRFSYCIGTIIRFSILTECTYIVCCCCCFYWCYLFRIKLFAFVVYPMFAYSTVCATCFLYLTSSRNLVNGKILTLFVERDITGIYDIIHAATCNGNQINLNKRLHIVALCRVSTLCFLGGFHNKYLRLSLIAQMLLHQQL